MAIDVKQAFNQFKSKLELSATLQKAITIHHNAIREWIESYDPNIETKLIGSLQRKTRIQPRAKDTFDIDILVILGKFHGIAKDGTGVSPSDAIDKLHKIMREHGAYRKMNPQKDYPTVFIEYEDNIKVELVPAYRDFIYEPKGQGYRIPKTYSKWTSADYDYDAEYISSKNKECGGWLIPTIKMLKAAKRNLFPEMKSYHLEVLATSIIPLLVEYYKSKNFQFSFHDLAYGFFLIAKDKVLKSCSIEGSKSPDASVYMTYNQKQNLANKFSKIADYCKSIIHLDGRDGIEGWKNLFGEPFPSYG